MSTFRNRQVVGRGTEAWQGESRMLKQQAGQAFTLVEIRSWSSSSAFSPRSSSRSSPTPRRMQAGNIKSQFDTLNNQIELYRARKNVYPDFTSATVRGPTWSRTAHQVGAQESVQRPFDRGRRRRRCPGVVLVYGRERQSSALRFELQQRQDRRQLRQDHPRQPEAWWSHLNSEERARNEPVLIRRSLRDRATGSAA